MTHDELVSENIAAKIPLIDPRKPKKKKVDVTEIPKEVLIDNLTNVVKEEMKNEF